MHSAKDTVAVFILKVWDMLQHPEQACLQWAPTGDSFSISDEEGVTVLLGQYFKHGNLASFIRQLNMYNFHKRKNLQGHITFTHPLFRQHHKHLLAAIKRKPSQADILEGEKLLRELQSDLGPVAEHGEMEEQRGQNRESQEQVREEQRELLGVLKWMGNSQRPTGGWRMEKKALTIVLKDPPCMDGENVNPGWSMENSYA